MVMKYITALKKYNEGSDKWCMPRKGSEDYLKIIEIMKKISSVKNSKERKIKILQAAIRRKLNINSTTNSKLISNSLKKISKLPSYNSNSRVFSNEILNF